MRYLTVVILMLFCITETSAQTYEIGPYIGGANFIGDVGSTNYISPNSLLFGGIARWNRSPRHSFRLSVLHTELEANDADSDDSRRQKRGFKFKNPITEVSLGIEYTFWEWSLYEHKPAIVPYLYTGLTGVLTHDLYLDRNRELSEKKSKFAAAIPMTLGVKGTLGRNFVLSLEVGARYTFTDNLDGSNPEEFDGGDKSKAFGNPNTNDWYMFTGVSLTYTFGRKPCYCNF